MSVHYKFKSSLEFDTITFDGLHISVSDLKKSIVHQKRLGKTGDFDLQITNAQTKEEYSDDSTLIPKNTSLIIARIPLVAQPRKNWDANPERIAPRQIPESDSSQVDLSRMNGTEEDKIKAMMAQSTIDYDPTNYQKIRGSNQVGEVPLNYRCFKCQKHGHWIKNCPLGSVTNQYKENEKRNTGIPRSFIERDEKNSNQETQPTPVIQPNNEKQEIPEDLICSICKSLFVDAVMIPCCGSSFCDECVRTALLESEDNECPDCKEKGSSPGSLIPNRFLRNSVNSFKNETGYNKPRTVTRPKPVEKEKPKADEVEIIDEETKESDIHEKLEIEEEIDEKMEKGSDEDKEENESDFEDNITVTVPPAHLTSHGAYKERNLIGRHPRLKPPGMDTPPKNNSQFSNINQEERSNTPTIDENEVAYNSIPSTEHSRSVQQQQQQQVPPQQMHSQMNMGPHVQSSNGYGNMPVQGPPMHYQQNQPPMQRPYDGGEYPMQQGYPQQGYVQHMGPYRHERPRGPFMQPRMPYGGMHNSMIRGPRHNMMPNSLAQVYQGVQAKVGTGIIDDPLEAFNRIMREKERRKEERRRTPHMEHGRRSRSHEMDRRRMSMERRRSPRMRSPNDRRRSPDNRRERSHMRESAERKRMRSSSYSSRSSRSFSRSRSPPRKRSLTPIGKNSRTPIRRSRSRSPSFGMNRYNNRFRNNRRGDGSGGRDYEFREKSPFYMNSRGRGMFRGGRGKNSSMHYRMDRSQNMYKDDNSSYHHSDYHDGGQYSQNVGRYSPRNQQNPTSSSSSQNRNSSYVPALVNLQPHPHYDDDMGYRNQYDDQQNDDQPPPPGFENSVEPCDRESSFNQKKYSDDFRRQGDNYNNNKPSSSSYDNENDKVRKLIEHSHTPSPDHTAHYEHTNKRHSKSRSKEKHESRKEKREEKIKKESVSKKTIEKIHDSHRKRNSATVDSTDDEKRDKKSSKDRKKKKRESEKKKNKKDKKEKREKEKRKSNEKEKIVRLEKLENKEIPSETETRSSKTPTPPMQIPQALLEQHKNIDLITATATSSTTTTILTDQNIESNNSDNREHAIDLYFDLPHENENRITTDIIEKDEDEGKEFSSHEYDEHIEMNINPTQSPNHQLTILHTNLDFETDEGLENSENERNNKNTPSNLPTGQRSSENNQSVLVSLPEPSKWELDEETGQPSEKKIVIEKDDIEMTDEDKTGKVTNEVLKRAENAIFARAINAIRPIEIKKISLERQKLYSNEKQSTSAEQSPVIVNLMKSTTSPPKETFQITVPTNKDSSERSVEIKTSLQTTNSEQQSLKSSTRISVKERLGSKIIETRKSKSFSKSPIRKVQLDPPSQPTTNYHSNDRNNRRHKENYNRNTDDNRRISQRNDGRKPYDNKRDNRREDDSDRDRRNRDMSRDKPRFVDNREKFKERERFGNNYRSNERKSRSRDRSKQSKTQNSNNEQNKSGDRMRNQENFSKSNDKDRERDKDKDKDKDSRRVNDKKRKRTRSRSLDRKKDNKISKHDQDDQSKKGREKDSGSSKQQKRGLHSISKEPTQSTSSSQSQPNKENIKLDRKRSIIDEANFIPDYDEQMEHESNNDMCSDKTVQEQIPEEIVGDKQIEKKISNNNKKESRKHRSSSTESSTDSTDTDTDQTENSATSSTHRRKKRKHKKQKKSKKTVQTSSDTDESHKKRRKKEKKSKSAKKKKKSKHK